MDFVLLPSKEVLVKHGKLFIEGRVRDDVRDDLGNEDIIEVGGRVSATIASELSHVVR